MSLSSLVATLGYYPISAGVLPGGPAVGVLYKRVEEDLPRPRIEVKDIKSIDIEVCVSIISLKSFDRSF